jgi:hypothetical protein
VHDASRRTGRPERPPRGGASGTVTQRALNRALLARQLLLDRARLTPVDVVERLAGLQAQVPRPPFIGLWTRLETFTRQDLTDRLHDRSIVRATMMRGTIHLVSAADYIAFRPVLHASLVAAPESMFRSAFEGHDLRKIVASGREFFARPNTFDALRKHFAERGPTIDARAPAYLVRMHLPLVQIPTADPWGYPASAQFGLAEEWLRAPVSVASVTPRELVRRYLAAFGPATPADAQAWSGIQSLRTVFEELRSELVTMRDERKRELFDLPDAPRPDEDTPAPVRFIPDYDNVVLGHKDRSRIIEDEHRPRISTANLQIRATYLVDGRVAGTWKIDRSRQAATLVLEPFGRLTKKTSKELEREAGPLLAFMEPNATTHAIRVAS